MLNNCRKSLTIYQMTVWTGRIQKLLPETLTEKGKFVFHRIKDYKTLLEKKKNTGCKHFLLFTQCFRNPSPTGYISTTDCVLNS